MPETEVKGRAGSQLSIPMFCALTCTGLRPDWIAHRVGEQNLKTYSAAHIDPCLNFQFPSDPSKSGRIMQA